ncbi:MULTISPECIES: restriction endonuclease subunit S [unclassified Flavobacterium]|jgi:type I restriction enzyme S subunit|uniref:restriction endonuclease subunit S n=1 Tax=unclassified Flavobacterium TaxID=196869 RepID=UPI0025BEC23A|nr:MULTISPECIES: restriction endonuclease subunit S [unclassified Flavobacterium]
MIKYDKYKSSGIDWLGDIPNDWEEKRVKNVFSFSKGLTITKKDLQDNGIYCVSYGEIHSKYSFEVNPDIPSLKCVDENYLITSNSSLLNRGDFVFSDTSEDIDGSGNFTYLNSDTRIFAGYHTIIAKPINVYNFRYLAYLLDSLKFRHQIRSKVAGIKVFSITQKLLKQLFVILPSNNEQTQIVNFLDTKTQAIDKKITLLTQKSNYYKEYRKSLINETVCKGLDKNVKLKDSGIDWIGQIPEHWDIVRLKSLGNIETSSVNKKIEENEGLIKLVNYTDVYGNSNKEIWNDDNYMVVSANIKQLQSKLLKKGDVLFTPSSETIEDIGVSAVVMENLNNTLYSYHLLRLRFSKNVFLNFKKYLFNNDFVQNYFSKSATGTTRKILGLSTYNNLLVIMPPTLKEQEAIATYLDQKTQTIDKIVFNINTQIQTLKELRKTLINDAVTGKIKVN